MALVWARRVEIPNGFHKATSMNTHRKPERHGGMDFPFQGSDTGQKRLKAISQASRNQAAHE